VQTSLLYEHAIKTSLLYDQNWCQACQAETGHQATAIGRSFLTLVLPPMPMAEWMLAKLKRLMAQEKPEGRRIRL
jgi:hypothetical protein